MLAARDPLLAGESVNAAPGPSGDAGDEAVGARAILVSRRRASGGRQGKMAKYLAGSWRLLARGTKISWTSVADAVSSGLRRIVRILQRNRY